MLVVMVSSLYDVEFRWMKTMKMTIEEQLREKKRI